MKHIPWRVAIGVTGITAVAALSGGGPAVAGSAAESATLTSAANIRAAPRTSSAILVELPAGSSIDVSCWTEGEPTFGTDAYGSMWLYTSLGGWVHSKLTTPVDVGPCGSASGYYANCDEAFAAGAGKVYAGEPGYAPHLDRDGDGIGC